MGIPVSARQIQRRGCGMSSASCYRSTQLLSWWSVLDLESRDRRAKPDSVVSFKLLGVMSYVASHKSS